MKKISPCLWFDTEAEEAARFYVSVFKNSKITKIVYRSENTAKVTNRKKGSVLAVTFSLNGQEFMALNGGPEFKFTQAISLMAPCKTQKELDTVWKKLTSGRGKGVACSWLKDKYGLSWQIVPSDIIKMIGDKDSKKSDRVLKEVWSSVKLHIATLRKAYKGPARK
jgi:predicted 3-demethylubiquinone-9 3-methyltransferase (glyoxalase superfamily)